MAFTEEESHGIELLDTMFRAGDHGTYYACDELIRKRSLAWLVDVAYRKWPNMMRISIPKALAACHALPATEEPILQGQTWEDVKASISKAVRDYLS